MKKRMIGIILMVSGTLLLVAGIILYSTVSKQSLMIADKKDSVDVSLQQETLTASKDVQNYEVKSEPQIKVEPKHNELERVIEKAIADGELTTNERELIKKTAISKGVDYVKVLDDLEKRINLLELDSESNPIDDKYKKGLDFEKFIVQKFDLKFFKIKEWAGDKYVNGVYAETTQHPDLLIEFFTSRRNEKFAVECKWRQNVYKEGIDYSNFEQLDRYRNYAKKNNVPVFIAIGLGGKSAAPERLFIVPLKDISKPFMLLTQLEKYEKEVKTSFHYYYKEQELK